MSKLQQNYQRKMQIKAKNQIHWYYRIKIIFDQESLAVKHYLDFATRTGQQEKLELLWKYFNVPDIFVRVFQRPWYWAGAGMERV